MSTFGGGDGVWMVSAVLGLLNLLLLPPLPLPYMFVV